MLPQLGFRDVTVKELDIKPVRAGACSR